MRITVFGLAFGAQLILGGLLGAQTRLGTGFNGPQGTDTPWSPLDPNAAVGPNHVVVVVNGLYRIYSKCGVLLASSDMDNLFTSLNPTAATIDPNVTFDDIAQRFVIESNGSGADITSAYIAISNSADPTQGFTEVHRLTFPNALDGSKAGFNADAYVITAQSGTAVMDKSTLLDANNATFTITSQVATVYGRPARMHGASPGSPMYFTRAGTGGTIRVTRMTNVLGATPTVVIQDVAGSTGCTDPCTSEWRANTLVSANTQATYWWQVDTATTPPSLRQQGFVPSPAGYKHAYGSASVAPNGDIGVSYMEYSVDTTPLPVSMWVAWRAAADPLNTLRTPVLAKSSGALLLATTGHGDFSSTVCEIAPDGSTRNSFWSCNGYLRPNGAGSQKASWLQHFGGIDFAGGDCNGNDIADACDLLAGTSTDANANGVPDECEGTITALCFGDGTGTPCPCANTGATGRGCAHSANPSGGRITATGFASVAAESLVLLGSGVPDGPGLYFQGTSPMSGGLGAAFGDGLLCAGGTITRLGIVAAFAGTSGYPTLLPPPENSIPLSVKGGVSPGAVLHYQLWYRDADLGFCTPSTFNLTNAVRVTWTF